MQDVRKHASRNVQANLKDARWSSGSDRRGSLEEKSCTIFFNVNHRSVWIGILARTSSGRPKLPPNLLRTDFCVTEVVHTTNFTHFLVLVITHLQQLLSLVVLKADEGVVL